MQVNNIKISKDPLSPNHELWRCISPDGRVLETFIKKESAIVWAKETKDFLKTPHVAPGCKAG